MILKIDFDSESPIYMQIKNQIIKCIANGEIEEGDELPSVRSLAEDIGVNLHTVNKSYSFLKDEGYIKMDRRRGSVISLNLRDSQEKFKNKFIEDLQCYMAECINRGISKEEIFKMINDASSLYENHK